MLFFNSIIHFIQHILLYSEIVIHSFSDIKLIQVLNSDFYRSSASEQPASKMGSMSANCIYQETSVEKSAGWRRLNTLRGDFPRTNVSDYNCISLGDKNLFFFYVWLAQLVETNEHKSN